MRLIAYLCFWLAAGLVLTHYGYALAFWVVSLTALGALEFWKDRPWRDKP